MSQGSVAEALTGLDVLVPRREGALQVFGLWRTPVSSLSYLTLDEALQAEAFEVSEISERGSVPEVKVENSGAARVFLMAGEELVGAKQNRVLNVSLMIPAHSAVAVPVSCVEAGRWRYSAPGFRSAGTSSHGKLRAKMAQFSNKSYRSTGRPVSNQEAVWKEVADKLEGMASSSPTEELQQIYKDHGRRLDQFSERIPTPEGCCGVVFAIGGEVVGVDVFDQPSTLARLWPKLLRSYAVDALERSAGEPELTCEAVGEWLREAALEPFERHESPGMGEDLRLDSDELVGGCLVVEGQAVHTELFPVRS